MSQAPKSSPPSSDSILAPSRLSFLRTIVEHPSVDVVIGDLRRHCTRCSFEGFLHIQEAVKLIPKNLGEGLNRLFAVYDIVLSDEDPFEAVLFAAVRLIELNHVRGTLPFLEGDAPERDDPPWHYEGRDPIVWIHLLARSYGWSYEKILALDVEELLCFVQEVLVEEHTSREWQSSLSTTSFNKDGKYVPLKRPAWMVSTQKPKKVRVLKAMLPKGNVVNLEALYANREKT